MELKKDTCANEMGIAFKFLTCASNEAYVRYIDSLLKVLDDSVLNVFHQKSEDERQVGFVKGLKFTRELLLKERECAAMQLKKFWISDNYRKQVHDYLSAFYPKETDDECGCPCPCSSESDEGTRS